MRGVRGMPGYFRHLLLRISFAVGLSVSFAAQAGIIPDAEAWERWRPSAANLRLNIDHSPWSELLATYLDANHPSGINRFDYAAVTRADRDRLDTYIAYLSSLPVAELTVVQQQAYWVNLYNALTVRLILDNPDVDSIRQIKESFFSIGPWNQDIITINGTTLTLNDIEHRILRPLYRDARVHFAVNCASLGCPNLAAQAYTADNLESLYDVGARAFINHSRGVETQGRTLRLSSIFSWFKEDFGDDRDEQLQWIANYADPALAETLRSWKTRVRYDYDWKLNAP